MKVNRNRVTYHLANFPMPSDNKLAMYVNPATGKDTNAGITKDTPKKTLTAAIDVAEPWTEFRVTNGTLVENVVLDLDNCTIKAEGRDGSHQSKIQPATGVPLKITANNCKIYDIACVSVDNNAIEMSGYKNELERIYVEIGCNGVYGIKLSDADEATLKDVYADGKIKDSVIGVFFGVDTVDAIIQNSYLTGWGSGIGHGANVGYAIGRSNAAQRITVIDNKLIDNWVGMYWYAPPGGITSLEGDCVCNNICIENQSYDFWDTHDWPLSANLIDGNFYGYSVSATENWYDDLDGDGIADFVARAGTSNRDRHPRSSPYAKHGISGLPRRATI